MKQDDLNIFRIRAFDINIRESSDVHGKSGFNHVDNY